MNVNTDDTRLIPLSGPKAAGRFVRVDAADYERLAEHAWFLTAQGYPARHEWQKGTGKGTVILMHRFIMGFPEGLEVDHADMDKLNNTRANLRLATKSQNAANRGLRSTNSTGYKGVGPVKGTRSWRARIMVDYKEIHLGCFATPEEAAHAVDDAALRHFGEFARLNFPK